MTRLALLVILLLAGCGRAAAPKPSSQNAAPKAAAAESGDKIDELTSKLDARLDQDRVGLAAKDLIRRIVGKPIEFSSQYKIVEVNEAGGRRWNLQLGSKDAASPEYLAQVGRDEQTGRYFIDFLAIDEQPQEIPTELRKPQ